MLIQDQVSFTGENNKDDNYKTFELLYDTY